MRESAPVVQAYGQAYGPYAHANRAAGAHRVAGMFTQAAKFCRSAAPSGAVPGLRRGIETRSRSAG